VEFVVAGLVLGGVYAVVAAGLVITYQSSGILNFAFGSEAYFIGRLYYFLNTGHGWGVVLSATFCVLVVSPLMGIALYLLIFRFLRLSSSVVKIVSTIGLSVFLPALAILIFGNVSILSVPGLAPQPVSEFHLLGIAVSLDQVIVLICVAVVALVGSAILRFTDVGLAVRAMVDSPALTSASGTSVNRVSLGVWAITTLLVGLTGILVAPTVGLSTPDGFTLLVVSAFAAVVAAKLRYVGRAAVVGLLLGVVGGIAERFVPSESIWSSASLTAIPFVFMAGFLLYYARGGETRDSGANGGALDRAISYVGKDDSSVQRNATRLKLSQKRALESAASRSDIGQPGGLWSFLRPGDLRAVLIVVAIGLLPLLLGGIWVGLVGLGLAYGIVFLSYTIVTGEGGMISLCQVTFAGIGGIAAAQLATNHHWPIMIAVLAGGLVALPLGILIGMISLALGDLYLALVTLTFGILMDNLVFTLNIFAQYSSGVVVNRPQFASTDRAYSYLALGVFCVVSLLVVNMRRSTTGMAAAAVRWSEPGSRSIGLSILQTKIMLTGFAAFVAAIGGGLLVLYDNNATPSSFSTLGGLVWLAVIVTVGIRSNVAAAVAGLTFSIIPAIFVNYLPVSLAQLPILLFGLGAVLVARNPDGALALQGRQLARLVATVTHMRAPTEQFVVGTTPAETKTYPSAFGDPTTSADRNLVDQ
jgi:branched-chain amino acid transport system permease protein